MSVEKWSFFHNLPKYLYRGSAIIGIRYPPLVNRFLSSCEQSLCDLTSPTGIRQFCHPDLVKFGKATYLAVTPYPYGVDLYENPEIFTRDIFSGWKLVAAVPPPPKGKHLSDPDLLVSQSRLHLLYRRCDREDPGIDEIILRDVENAKESCILKGPKNSLICPSSVTSKTVFVFTVDARSIPRILVRHEFDDRWNIVSTTECGNELPELWHIDIVQVGNILWGLFLSNESTKKYGNSLFLMQSEDEGSTFLCKTEIKIDDDDVGLAYRASMILSGDVFHVFLSYRTKMGKWRLCSYLMSEDGVLSKKTECI